MTRRQNSADSEAPQTTDTPAPAVPLGTQADVTVKYKTQVDPNQSSARERERDELADLAELANMQEPPLDEVSEYCYTWAKYAGQPLSVIRLPDPPERRIPGKGYALPCFTLERLGTTTFDPNSLIDTLRFINNNSGGVFRIWLNYNGVAIPESRLEPIAIGDPIGSHLANLQPQQQLPSPQWQQPPPPPLPPQKSESEQRLDQLKDKLFFDALTRATNPLPPIGVPGSNLPPEDQATLFLLSKTDFLGNIFTKMTDLAQQSASVSKEATWRERMIDAGVELATKNPAIVDRLGGVVERIFARVLPDPRFDGLPQSPPQSSPGYYNQTPAYMPQQQPFTSTNAPPDAPEPEDDEDEDTMDILDSLVALLNSDRELTLSDPVLLQLKDRYPLKFGFAAKMIIRSPLDDILDWIKITGGPVYVSMLEGHSGPYLIERMARLQTLIIEASKKANTNAKTKQQTTGAPETST